MGNSPSVVITGLGTVNSLGKNVDETWEAMKRGHCAIGPFRDVERHDLKNNVGAELTEPVTAGLSEREMVAFDRFTLMALQSAQEAIDQSGLSFDNPDLCERTGAIIGVGACGWHIVEKGYRDILVEGSKRLPVLTVPRFMPSAASAQISMRYGLKGPVYGVTSACSSSNHGFISAYQSIKSGAADVVIAGGADAPLIWGILRGWEALRVLAPDTCKPFSLNRRGLVLADGAGVAVLENADHAKARGANILAELAGVGMNADAGDLVMPTVEGPSRAIELALKSGDLSADDVDYINAHGTGTKANDKTETKVIREVFGSHADALSVSSTKSMHGHALGGSGGIELIACVKSMIDGIVPPTVNYEEVDPECDLDITANAAKTRAVKCAISNAFAFGGTNAVIALKQH